VTQHNHPVTKASAMERPFSPQWQKKAHHKEKQSKNPEPSARLRLISKMSSRGLTNASEGTEAWTLELGVPRKKDLQKSPKSWQPGFRVQLAARTTEKLSLREQGSWETLLTK